MGTISIPKTASKTLLPDSAPADEVRAYIAQLLVKKYDTDIIFAEECASKWEIGRFSQLSSASQEVLRGIFGNNVGICIHDTLQEDISMFHDRKPTVIISGHAAIASGLVLASISLLFLLPELGLQDRRDRIKWAKSPGWWFLFGICGILHAFLQPYREVRAVTLMSGGVFAFIMGFALLSI